MSTSNFKIEVFLSFSYIQVFTHFNLGFHRDWEAYSEKCFVKEFMAAADLECMLGTNKVHF